jgi:AraC-like DNA-binding protein
MNNDSKHPAPGRPVVRDREGPRIRAEAHAREIRAQDYWRVNLEEAWEIRFWSREFGCSESELRSAVERVGDAAGDVRARLAHEHQQQRS